MKKGQFSFATRQAMQVALAVAEELVNNTSRGRPFGERQECETRPVLMNFNKTTFRFEGGAVVKVNMIDLDQFTESWRTPHRQDWVVTHCEVRYYKLDNSFRRASDDKEEDVWEGDKLLLLKQARPWWHPHVQHRLDIKGTVGVFINKAAGEGYIEVDPERNQAGHYTMYDQVKYRRFLEDDLERARAEARKILDGYLTVNAVAVFYNRPSGEAYCEDSPTGNYKGSGHSPFTYMGEYSYDPADSESHKEALRKAKADVESFRS